MKIPYLDLKSLNALHQQEMEEAALRVIRSGNYLRDSEVDAFEKKWAEYNGAKYCVSTANGLDALTAILVALKVINKWQDNAEVIVSAHTFIASFEAITRAGLTPVPCDASKDNYLIDTELIEPLISKNTVAIMPVHLYGRLCDMARIKSIAEKHNLRVVADACQSAGMRNTELMCDAAATSFYPGKNIGALGDAGCLVTDNEELARIARAFCNYGSEEKYVHNIKGINSRMDSVQAAMLSVKLNYLDEENRKRQEIACYYNSSICNPNVQLPYDGKCADESVWHIYPVFCKKRNLLQQYLKDKGIDTIVHYPTPPHKQLAYSEMNGLELPVTQTLCDEELSIPLNPTLTKEQQEYIVETINKFSL